RRPARGCHLRAAGARRAETCRDLAPVRRRHGRGTRRRRADRLSRSLRRRRRGARGPVIADLLTATLAEEIAAATELRAFVPTTPATRVAANAARNLGAPGLALARGFTDLDAGQRGSVLDVFTLLRRGRLGVAVAPIQLDSAGRTN